jgi:RNA polymerase sigma factor (sigma-70 family)
VEASALNPTVAVGLRGPTPLLRLQSDERLIVLVRRGNHAAFEALVARYQARLLAFCRHMLGSREDAEDVLQEVFAASFNAIMADDRAINVRPWLYRIARNRSLNHLRRVQPIGVDSMDVHLSDGGATTADKVHKREDFRLLVADVQDLPETQKTALLLREIDALSYEQIAEAMETTIPSVKSLLVRARVSLAEAAEARQLSCEQVREELGEVAEGLKRSTAPARRHLRTCERCQLFKAQLRSTNKALAAVFPVAPLLFCKKVLLAHFGMSASAGAGGAAGAAAATVATSGGTSAMSAGISTIATKAAAGLAAAAIVTAGAVEVKHASHPARTAAVPQVAVQAPPAEPQVVAAEPQQVVQHAERHVAKAKHTVITPKADPNAPANAPAAALTPAVPNQTDQGGSTVALPAPAPTSGTESDPTATGGSPQPTSSEPAPSAPTDPVAQPAPTTTTPPPPPPTSADPSTTPPSTTTDPPPPDGDPSDPPPPAP